MPEATTTHTRTPPDIVGAIMQLVSADGDGELTITVQHAPAERGLLRVCQAAMVHGEVMRLLTHAVADMPPSDLRHEASNTVVDQLRPEWIVQLNMVSALPALGTRGVAAKAAVIASLVGPHDADPMGGLQALRIAASLAHDLLALDRS